MLGAGLKPAPAASRKGTETSRKSTTISKNPLVFLQVSVLIPTLLRCGEEGLRRTASSSITLPWGKGRGSGHTRKVWPVPAEDAGCVRMSLRGPSPKQSPTPSIRGPKSRASRDFGVSLVAMTGRGRLRSVQRGPCGHRPDQFVEESSVFMVPGEVLLMEGPLVRRGFPGGARWGYRPPHGWMVWCSRG